MQRAAKHGSSSKEMMMKLKETTKNKLFYVLLGVGFVLNVLPANAYESVNATITKHYKTVIDRKPYVVEVCEDRAVSGDRSGDMLTGAIIGGIIGNNVTKNVENGGAVGALLGGMLGHNNSTATSGTRRVLPSTDPLQRNCYRSIFAQHHYFPRPKR